MDARHPSIAAIALVAAALGGCGDSRSAGQASAAPASQTPAQPAASSATTTKAAQPAPAKPAASTDAAKSAPAAAASTATPAAAPAPAAKQEKAKPAAAPKPATAKAEPKPAKPAEERKDQPKWPDWDDVIKAARIEGQQLADFKAKLAERDAKLKAWYESSGYEKSKEALAQKKEKGEQDKDLETRMDQLRAQEQELKTSLRRDVLALLTLEQNHAVAGLIMRVPLAKHFHRVGLSDEQLKRAEQACAEVAATAFTAETYRNDPYLKATSTPELRERMFKAVRERVLTDEQRKQYDAMQAERAKQEQEKKAAGGTSVK